jgi:hypothetical protein
VVDTVVAAAVAETAVAEATVAAAEMVAVDAPTANTKIDLFEWIDSKRNLRSGGRCLRFFLRM